MGSKTVWNVCMWFSYVFLSLVQCLTIRSFLGTIDPLNLLLDRIWSDVISVPAQEFRNCLHRWISEDHMFGDVFQRTTLHVSIYIYVHYYIYTCFCTCKQRTYTYIYIIHSCPLYCCLYSYQFESPLKTNMLEMIR